MSGLFRPPRAVEWLLVLVVGREGWYVLGDLREEYADLRREAGRRDARRWFWTQMAAIGPRLALRRLSLPWWRGGRSRFRSEGETTRARSERWRPADWRGPGWLDLREALRSAGRRPGFAGLIAGTLGVGIAAVALLVAVIEVTVLAPLPFADSDRVVALETSVSDLGWFGSSAPEFLEQRELGSLGALAGYGRGIATLGDSLAPRRETVIYATAELLPLLGRAPRVGRFFSPDEDLPGGPLSIVLSERIWTRDYGARTDVIGSTTLINGRATTIVGVMPGDFAFPTSEAAAWLPWRLDLLDAPGGRGNHFMRVVGRLGDGVTLAEARVELAAHTERIAALDREHYSAGYRTRLRPFIDTVVGDARRPVWLLVSAAVLLLVIATANVSTLLIGRAHAREHEIEIRAALGAGRLRASAPYMIEAWLGVVAGGAVGLSAAALGVRVVSRSEIMALPRADLLHMTPATWAAGAVLVIATGLVATLSPSLTASAGRRLGGPRRAGRRVVGDRRVHRSQRILVASQVALAAALCMGTGLMARTIAALQSVDTGLRAESVLTLRVTPQSGRYGADSATVEFHRRLRERLAAVPGVEAAGSALNLPYGGRYNNQFTFQRIEDANSTIGESPVATVQFASPGFVEAAGLRVSAGRSFDPDDDESAPPVVMVNESMARRFWPGEEALGQRMRVFNTGPPKPWMEVVGVVADVHAEGLDRPAPPIYYVPTTQAHASTFFTPLERVVLLRTRGAPAGLASAVRTAIAEIDPTTAVSAVRTLEAVIDASEERRRATLQVLALLSSAALLLATIGVAGATAASVRIRRGSIGIRKALGQTAGAAAGEVIAGALRVVAIGIAIGMLGSLAGGSFLASLVHGVRPWDPATALTVSGVLVLTAVLAAAAPALAAARTDPQVTLRAEGPWRTAGSIASPRLPAVARSAPRAGDECSAGAPRFPP